MISLSSARLATIAVRQQAFEASNNECMTSRRLRLRGIKPLLSGGRHRADPGAEYGLLESEGKVKGAQVLGGYAK